MENPELILWEGVNGLFFTKVLKGEISTTYSYADSGEDPMKIKSTVGFATNFTNISIDWFSRRQLQWYCLQLKPNILQQLMQLKES
ncbi:hypothetical protein JTB14_002763 [Gonioctena quinquepunctata]|nr:hypothetical protein JTB14_002763 [Gonioctena quinquepunctata]